MKTSDTFIRLATMIGTDPDAYRREVAKMRLEDPDKFREFVSFLRSALATANRAEDDITERRMGTPSASKEYLRRHSSITALVLGVEKSQLPEIPRSVPRLRIKNSG